MTNTSMLKKGSPPARETVSNLMNRDPRPSEEKNRPLQVQVTQEIFEAFSAKAGAEFGYSKGAKSRLFLEMWQVYNSRKP